MSDTKTHTPGPWKVQPVIGTWIQTEGDPYGHGQMHIADVRGWGHLTGGGACHLSEDKAIAIQTANAHLIAAAPSMLYALRAIQRSCPTDPDVTREFNAAWGLLEAAIAKAEGP